MKRGFLPIFLIAIVSICLITTSCSNTKIPVEPKNQSNTDTTEKKLGASIVEEKNKSGENKTEKKDGHNEKKATKVPVLLYHHLLTQEDIEKYNWTNNKIVFPVEAFEKQMKYLHDNNFHTATLDELNQFVNGQLDLPEKTVVLTFDDGFLSNAVYAYPIMKKYNLKGTIFVIGSAAEESQRPFDPKTVQYINVNEMGKYRDVFAFESHTYKLHKMNKNNKPLLVTLDQETVIEDLSKNKKLLNAKYIAYPFGSYNNKIIELLKTVGYKLAFTVRPDYVTKDLNKYELPRFEIVSKTSMDEFIKIVEKKK